MISVALPGWTLCFQPLFASAGWWIDWLVLTMGSTFYVNETIDYDDDK